MAAVWPAAALLIVAAGPALGDSGSWKFGAETRSRFDGRGDRYALTRLRLSSTFIVRPWLRLIGETQDARAIGFASRPIPCSLNNTLDLRQAYVDIGHPDDSHWRLRAGRQPLAFGDMRLIGTSGWSNSSPTFDAVRLTHRMSRGTVDWFAAAPVSSIESFDRPGLARRIAGAYGSVNLGHGVVAEPYLLWKGMSATGTSVFAPGIRAAGRLRPSTDFNVEATVQRGRAANEPLAAWSSHIEIGRRIGSLRLWGEHNYSSGDRDPHDGRRGTFEQFMPSPLSVVARAVDLASRNLHEPATGIEWQFRRSWRVRAVERFFLLSSTQDALSCVSGAVYAFRPGARHRYAGTEFDF